MRGSEPSLHPLWKHHTVQGGHLEWCEGTVTCEMCVGSLHMWVCGELFCICTTLYICIYTCTCICIITVPLGLNSIPVVPDSKQL